MKGGHATGAICTDFLITPTDIFELTASRIDTKNTHGTGCTLSSSIAACFAKGDDLETSIHAAHRYLQGAIAAADTLQSGAGHGPVHHFHQVWS
jgi:hydroxymethylpyrimidine/phosphomethylpyrimidine kinase